MAYNQIYIIIVVKYIRENYSTWHKATAKNKVNSVDNSGEKVGQILLWVKNHSHADNPGDAELIIT